MKELPEITITKMMIGEYEVPVPRGLSELLNRAGAWGIPEEPSEFVKKYESRVEKREDGSIATILTYKG